MKTDWTASLPPTRTTGDVPTGGVAADMNLVRSALTEVRSNVPSAAADVGAAATSHAHAAADLASGTVATARLGSGTASSTTFLRGDQTWATPSGGGGSSGNAMTVFNVKTDYGAAGNGSTNDAATIQNAINACQTAGGGIVYFPPGTYMVGSTLVISNDRVMLAGAGMDTTVLQKTGNFVLLQITGTAANHTTGCGVRDMMLNGGDFTATLLEISYGTRNVFENLHLFGNVGIGIDTCELWDSRFTNVYVEWCGGSTSAEPGIYVRSARASSGAGSSVDSTNQIVFVGCLVETWAGCAIRVAGGGNSGYIHSIHFYGSKIETGRVRGSAIIVDADATNVSFVDTYVYMDTFDTGYSTPVPAISTAGSGSIKFDSCFIGVGAVVLTTGISVTGTGTQLSNVEGNYDAGAPTSGNHIEVGASGFTVSQIRASNATNLVSGASTSVQANPGSAIRAVAGAVSNASFSGAPAVGTLAVDTTNGRLYVKTAATTWRYATLT